MHPPSGLSANCRQGRGVLGPLIAHDLADMSDKQRYRQLAALSRRMKQRTGDRELAEQLERIAAEYDRLADQVPDEASE